MKFECYGIANCARKSTFSVAQMHSNNKMLKAEVCHWKLKSEVVNVLRLATSTSDPSWPLRKKYANNVHGYVKDSRSKQKFFRLKSRRKIRIICIGFQWKNLPGARTFEIAVLLSTMCRIIFFYLIRFLRLKSASWLRASEGSDPVRLQCLGSVMDGKRFRPLNLWYLRLGATDQGCCSFKYLVSD